MENLVQGVEQARAALDDDVTKADRAEPTVLTAAELHLLGYAVTFDDALERLTRAWQAYADRYDPIGNDPDWDDEEQANQYIVNDVVGSRLDRTVCDVLDHAPPAETSDAIERLWNAYAYVVNGRRADEDAWIALEDAVAELVGRPKPAYRRGEQG
jgi:hypothetical protein